MICHVIVVIISAMCLELTACSISKSLVLLIRNTIFRHTEFAENNKHKARFTKSIFQHFILLFIDVYSCLFQLLRHLLYLCIELLSGVFICVFCFSSMFSVFSFFVMVPCGLIE